MDHTVFAGKADHYDKGRPHYPQEITDHLVEESGLYNIVGAIEASYLFQAVFSDKQFHRDLRFSY